LCGCDWKYVASQIAGIVTEKLNITDCDRVYFDGGSGGFIHATIRHSCGIPTCTDPTTVYEGPHLKCAWVGKRCTRTIYANAPNRLKCKRIYQFMVNTSEPLRKWPDDKEPMMETLHEQVLEGEGAGAPWPYPRIGQPLTKDNFFTRVKGYFNDGQRRLSDSFGVSDEEEEEVEAEAVLVHYDAGSLRRLQAPQAETPVAAIPSPTAAPAMIRNPESLRVVGFSHAELLSQMSCVKPYMVTTAAPPLVTVPTVSPTPVAPVTAPALTVIAPAPPPVPTPPAVTPTVAPPVAPPPPVANAISALPPVAPPPPVTGNYTPPQVLNT